MPKKSSQLHLSAEIHSLVVGGSSENGEILTKIEHSFRVLKISLCNLQRKFFKTLKDFEKISKFSQIWKKYFLRDFFRFEKNIFFSKFFLFQLKILSGIQKSYLENRAIILKMWKIQNPSFFTQNKGF